MSLSLLRDAFRATLRTRWLWPFALVTTMIIGSGIGSAIFQTIGADPAQGALATLTNPTTGVYGQAGALWTQARATGTGATVALAAFLVLIALLTLGAIALSVYALTTCVVAAGTAARGATVRAHARRALRSALPLYLLVKLVTFIVLLAWQRIYLAAAVTGGATIAAWLGFIVTALILSVVHIAFPFAIAAIAIDRRTVGVAIAEAFALIRDRFLVVVEASLLFTVAHVAAALAWLIGSIVLAMPFVLLGGIGVALRIAPLATYGAVAGGLIAVVLALIAVAAVYTSFLIHAWTFLYQRLTASGPAPEAWIVRKLQR